MLINHKFLNYTIEPDTEILIVGTFNPGVDRNNAGFFYSRGRNYLWRLLSVSYEYMDLKNATVEEKTSFIKRYKIGFADLIEQADIEENDNYDDRNLDSRVTIWNNIPARMQSLPDLKKICITRKTFGDVPNMKKKVDEIKDAARQKSIGCKELSTPARFYNQAKQNEWTQFLLK